MSLTILSFFHSIQKNPSRILQGNLMFIVCEKCKKVFVDGKWVVAVPPIGHVQYTLCAECGGHHDSAHGMVYMEKQRQLNHSEHKKNMP